MSASDDARDALQTTADFLSKVPFASTHLLFVATAFRGYLDGTYDSMDKALGLRLGVGKHERPENSAHAEMICRAFHEHINGKPFRTIAELAGYDEKEFRRLFNRYKYHAIERLADRLAKELGDDI